MRRRAVIVGYCALLMSSGCAWLRPREERLLSSSSQTALGRHLSQSAQAAIDRQDYVRARDDLERLVAGSPRSAEAHHRLGRVMQLQGEWAEAGASYRRALELDPEYVAALIGQGEVEAQLGRHDTALQRLDDAIEIDPHQAEAHLAEGRVLEAQGKIDEALAAYFRSLELEPNSPAVSLRVATLQLARKQTDQALARLDQVLEMAPDDPEAHHQRGLAHLALKHPDPGGRRPPLRGRAPPEPARRLLPPGPGPQRRPQDRGRPPGHRASPEARPRVRRRPQPVDPAQALTPARPHRRTTGLRSVPSPSISTSTTSPGWSQTGGLRAIPTPGGVPVKIRSPGWNVKTRER